VSAEELAYVKALLARPLAIAQRDALIRLLWRELDYFTPCKREEVLTRRIRTMGLPCSRSVIHRALQVVPNTWDV